MTARMEAPALRDYLDVLAERPGEFLRIDEPVRPKDFEVTAVLEQLDRRGRFPAVRFDNPSDLRGRPSRFPVLTNLFASRQRCAEMLALDPADAGAALGPKFADLADGSITPTVVSSDEAPVHAHVLRGGDATMDILPGVRHFEMDLGAVLTMAHVMKGPEGEFYNVTFAKTTPQDGGTRGGVTIHTPDMSRMLREWQRRGERVPIINVLGHDPAFWLGALALTPYGTNEYATIGSCMGRPVRLAPSVTWGRDFLVPADAEIIVEAELVPGEQTVVNPFGEISRQYQAQQAAPVIEVKAITYRDGAIMQDIYSAHRDHFLLGLIPREGSVFRMLRREMGNVTAVHLPPSGCGRFTCYISLHEPLEGQAKLAAYKTLAQAPMFQTIVVVDDEIDVFNEEDVLWAMTMYVDPSRDVDMAKGMRGPTDYRAMGDRRLIIDATRPRTAGFPARPRVPDAAMRDALRLLDGRLG